MSAVFAGTVPEMENLDDLPFCMNPVVDLIRCANEFADPRRLLTKFAGVRKAFQYSQVVN